MVGVRLEGLDDLQRALKAGNKKVTAATRRAITEITEEVAHQADDLVPYDTGDLSRSQMVQTPTAAGPIVGEVTYGGTTAPYAVVQHESLEFWHPPKPPGRSKVGGHQGVGPVQPGQGRGPKYLEYPLLRKEATFGRDLIAAIQRELDK